MISNRNIDILYNILVIFLSLLGILSTYSNVINGFTIINIITLTLNALLYLAIFLAYGKAFIKSKGKRKSKYFREIISISLAIYSLGMILTSAYYNTFVNYIFLLSLGMLWLVDRTIKTKLIFIILLISSYITISLLQFFSILPITHEEASRVGLSNITSYITSYQFYILISFLIIISILTRKVISIFYEKYSGKKLAAKLTPRQKEITILFQKGLNDKEVIDRLNISQGTMKKHKHDIWKVLKVSNQNEFIDKIKHITFNCDSHLATQQTL